MRLQLPESTTVRLLQFQRQVRRIKLAEGILAALFGLAVSYGSVLVLDRFIDTSVGLRATLLIAGSLALAVYFPLMCHRWVWQTRQLEQVARLLKRRFPGLGDQLLGVIELARDPVQYSGSQTLAQAAIHHVDSLVRDRDFSDAVPQPRHLRWLVITVVPALLIVLAVSYSPAAAYNALQRWLAPWRQTERFTFARIAGIPPDMVVPHGEEFSLKASLQPDSAWNPTTATAVVNRAKITTAERTQNSYQFLIPGQTAASEVRLKVGDVRQSVRIQPEQRPEVVSAQATVQLPDYLNRSEPLIKDIRAGSLSVVQGSAVAIHATTSRELRQAQLTWAPKPDPAATAETSTRAETHTQAAQRIPASTSSSSIVSEYLSIDGSVNIDMSWQDSLGLSPRDAFHLKLQAVDDFPPVISCQQLEPQQVILSTDVITFDLSAADDYGVRLIGLEWKGMADAQESPETGYQVEAGEKVAAAGAPDQDKLKSTVTFCADSDNITPQLLELRAWASDYYPDRPRTYSPSYVLHIMRPNEHAIWIASQLRRWASRAEDVYEEEMRLHATNRELRSAGISQLTQPELQQTLAQQIAAERANAARLTQVADQGRVLIEQALRNQEMQADHLETWASALLNLEKISQQKMPSVADLLNAAARASARAGASGSEAPENEPSPQQTPPVGNNRSTPTSPAGAQPDELAQQDDKAEDDPESDADSRRQAPKIEDVESGFNPANAQDPDEKSDTPPDDQKKKSGPGRLTLPETTLQGGPAPPKSDKKPLPPNEAEQDLEQAVEIQESLLLDFERIRDDLQAIMDDLENSTFVKRLKAASRRQLEIAHDLHRTLSHSFGVDYRQLEEPRIAVLEAIAGREQDHSRLIWNIQSDMEAYMSRVPDPASLRILDEMKELEAVTKIAALGERIQENMTGEAISRAEFWADVLDRWAEELVPVPADSSSDKSKDQNKPKGSLPPAIVLEVMRILNGEIDLREETRSLEQVRKVLPLQELTEKAQQQATQQSSLADRTGQVMQQIRELPEGGEAFENELVTLSDALHAMTDARTILSVPDTGPAAIAAETEAIECLLRAKRSQPKDGSGKSSGGSAPGTGTEGTTDQPALALLGPSSDARAKIQQRGVSQATGNAETALPEEFREGLDAFFNAVEGGR